MKPIGFMCDSPAFWAIVCGPEFLKLLLVKTPVFDEPFFTKKMEDSLCAFQIRPTHLVEPYLPLAREFGFDYP